MKTSRNNSSASLARKKSAARKSKRRPSTSKGPRPKASPNNQKPSAIFAHAAKETSRTKSGGLHAQALRYKTLMETSKDSIYVLNEKGDLQEANAAFLLRRGYTAAEIKRLNVADWDWKPHQFQERRRRLMGRSSVFETRHRCKDGSIFDVEVCATDVRINGEQLIFCMTGEITGTEMLA